MKTQTKKWGGKRPGAGRPVGSGVKEHPGVETISVSGPRDLLVIITAAAEAMGISRSQFMIEAAILRCGKRQDSRPA